MGIVVKVSGALQRLLGEIAESAAAESGVIQRERGFTAMSLARTFVLGFCTACPAPQLRKSSLYSL